MVIIIIAREFIISGSVLVASDNGIVIAASWWEIENNQPDDYDHSSDRRHSGTFRAEYRADLVALILTVVSLIDYLVKNKNVLSMQN